MPFKRYVEIGRLALVNYGEDYGKLVVISDVVDQNRALVDAPEETRKVMNFKRLAMTDFKVDIPRLASKKVLKAKLAESDVLAKFKASAWGQKLAKQASRAATTDFDRFKAAVAKSKKARAVRKVLSQLKKTAQKK
mmetsp:Transcript_26481/g.57780  ORF Transcript_26481/g.57780 Transcript_26481/m.57780 type:complete len:136 (-) Transcript_26481:313-720(-)|eukprot:CAMPEP_0202898628 /NCGR_PEP_ID=MMETSP1392-20130828/7101_1 /ASSEMBLY_ACC=CAM_ASM_000868 /TAXON_ID=225041 /ORGANISM="Chlamydomonas chlamydogama, Strain SAG 11-48b" /LENGTH=135 /DNA_ID=CAMNT_0049584615 /DNA_START=63 /DNA_END=470 /DNA_ORIENTATION=-